ncbi:MAG: hypothetical protein JW717_11010 [Marinilabiliaceae bacterium]|nr:hypothetical protein [Marinilabiliaceae bacterium]
MKKYLKFKFDTKARFILYIISGITIFNILSIISIQYALKTNNPVIISLLVLITLTAILSIFISIIYKKFNKTLLLAIKTAHQISEGNLVFSLPNNKMNGNAGQMIQELNVMSKQLIFSIKQIRKIANSINKDASGYGNESEKLAEGASEMAATVQQISSAIQQMTANIHINTENSLRTQSIAKDALNGVKKGNDSTQRMRESMSIVAQKIAVVQEIAAQTNILALNAAVEAARAGDAGRGFSVVATEVKKLAEKSRVSAIEIEKLTRKSLLISERAGIDLEKLVPQISETSKLVDEIATSSKEQEIGAEQIADAINQLNTVSQENALFAESFKTRSENMIDSSVLLKDIIKDYKIA